MSYDLGLYHDKEGNDPVPVAHFEEGGTRPIGGSDIAELNITYNYAPYFYDTLGKDGLRGLYGKKAKDCIELLEKAVETLGTERDSDYWKCSAGNAGYALSILLKWARATPEAYFNGD